VELTAPLPHTSLASLISAIARAEAAQQPNGIAQVVPLGILAAGNWGTATDIEHVVVRVGDTTRIQNILGGDGQGGLHGGEDEAKNGDGNGGELHSDYQRWSG